MLGKRFRTVSKEFRESAGAAGTRGAVKVLS